MKDKTSHLIASVKDYVNHIQDVAGAIKVILNKESSNRQEEVWKVISQELSASSYTRDDGSVRMDNECICMVGSRV